MPGLRLYADDLVLCGESEEDLMVGRLADLCRRRDLKVNAGKSKVMVLGGEEGLECEVCVDGICLRVYLGCIMEESVTDEAECGRKVESGRR